MKKELEAEFPLSREITVDGSRHLAREKVLQILNACFVSEVPWTEIFSHIFGRRFKFDEEENAGEQAKSEGRLLRSNEVYELDADIPINWQGGEIRFAQRLSEDVMRNRKMLEEILAEYAQTWDSDRIALIDKLLILFHFPFLHPKISKFLCSTKIHIFRTNNVKMFLMVEVFLMLKFQFQSDYLLRINHF